MSGKSYSECRIPVMPFVPEGALLKTAANRARLADRCSLEEAAEAGETPEALCTLCDCGTMQLTVELTPNLAGLAEVCGDRALPLLHRAGERPSSRPLALFARNLPPGAETEFAESCAVR